MAKKPRSHKLSVKQRSPKPRTSNPFSRKRGLSVQLIAGVIAFALLAGGSLAQWRVTTAPSVSDKPVTSTASLPELPARPTSDVAGELPPEPPMIEPPMVYPTMAGYNAYTSGGLPPGALPAGVVLPGMMNPAMPNPNAAYPMGMMPPMMAQGGRTTAQGYGVYDGVRQQFTGKERDTETGLDYFGARYYSSTQGRFTSVDPENASADLEDPQSWNGYAYARNNPLKYVDPDGRKYLICKNGECYEHSDAEFANLKKNLGGLTLTGNGNFYERGNILDGEGNVVGQYAQTSIDNPEHRAIATIAGAVAPVPRAFAYLYGGSVLAGVGAGGVLYAAGGAGAATTIGLGGASQSSGGLATSAVTVGGRTVNIIGNALNNVRSIGSGRLAGYIRGNTNLSGGDQAARAAFRQLTGRDPVGNFERVVQGGKEVLYRAASEAKSGVSKVEVVDHAQRVLQKISFK